MMPSFRNAAKTALALACTTLPAGAALLAPAPLLAADAAPKNPYTIPAPPKGKGQIVFYRSSMVGALISCAVSENDTKVSSLGVGRFFVVATEPGKHTYTVSSEAKDTLNLEVEADETQYAECHVKMGIMAGRPVLRPGSADEFKSRKLKPANTKDAAAGVVHIEEIKAD